MPGETTGATKFPETPTGETAAPISMSETAFTSLTETGLACFSAFSSPAVDIILRKHRDQNTNRSKKGREGQITIPFQFFV